MLAWYSNEKGKDRWIMNTRVQEIIDDIVKRNARIDWYIEGNKMVVTVTSEESITGHYLHMEDVGKLVMGVITAELSEIRVELLSSSKRAYLKDVVRLENMYKEVTGKYPHRKDMNNETI